MIAGNGFEPLAGRPPERRAGFSHATARLRPGNRYASDKSSTGAPSVGSPYSIWALGGSACGSLVHPWPAGRWFTLDDGRDLQMAARVQVAWVGSADGPVHRGSPDAEDFLELSLE